MRLVPGRMGIAFVESEAEAGAFSAKESTTEMKFRGDTRCVKAVYQRQ